MIKPMLATDFDEKKLKFPLIAQPKIDGVRGLNLEGSLTGRSLKPHANIYTTAMFSQTHYKGLDGELAFGDQTDPNLCFNTTSAVNSIKGTPDVDWHVFDLITPATIDRVYARRYEHLQRCVDNLHETVLGRNIYIVPSVLCENLDDLLFQEGMWLDQGYEGVIIRNPDGLYKQGRSTVREGGLLRIKRFMQEDATVLAVVEGNANGNEAKTNELGRTERSTHQANMKPNGLVGTLLCRLHKDVFDAHTGVNLLEKGQEITVSAGSMTHKDRAHYLLNPDEIVLKTIQFKFFPKGIKDKPRFPTFVSIRARSDKV